MKRKLAMLFTIMMLSLACACGQGDEQTEGSDANQEAGGDAGTDDSSPSSEDNQQQEEENQKGTRSNPYAFTDEIEIASKDWYSEDDVIVEYTIKLSELWGSGKVKAEYPNYRMEDRVLARGQILVNCDATDDAIDFGLTATFITSSLNEEPAEFEAYKSGELSIGFHDVYSGGTYDVIILGGNDGVGSMDLKYLKLEYNNADGQDASAWIELPDASEYINATDTGEESAGNDGSSTDGEADPQDESDTDGQISDDGESSDSEDAVAQVNYTPEELDALLIEQPMFVESTNYIVQDESLKALYPDMLQAVLKNNSGSDIKSAVVGFVAWDENNLPVKIYNNGVDINGSYVKLCDYDNINVVSGESFGEESGYSIDANKCSITTFKAIVVSYEDYDGNTWENPYFDAWVALYSEKRLE